jgi:hypothetical protein
VLLGCGTNRPEIPDELKHSSNAYGREEGDTVQNFCFRGFHDPQADRSQLETVCFYDYHDPNLTKGYALLLVNTAAVWCQACKVEHSTLPDRYRELSQRGLGLISALFEDNDSNPAQAEHLNVWIDAFDVNYAMVLDPEYQMGIYASRETRAAQPFDRRPNDGHPQERDRRPSDGALALRREPARPARALKRLLGVFRCACFERETRGREPQSAWPLPGWEAPARGPAAHWPSTRAASATNPSRWTSPMRPA